MTLFNIFLGTFLIGGTLMVLQTLLGVVGLGGDHDAEGGADGDADDGGDAHHDHGESGGHDGAAAWFVGVLTFRTLVAASTFFGLGGLAALQAGLDDLQALGLAVVAGILALLGVAFLMRSLGHLRADGAVRIDRAVGKTATVYLKIPGRKAGAGKVTLCLQNRTVEYQAVTSRDELPTGAQVVVVAVLGANTVEVVAAETGSAVHA